jgi:hypothetical protein
MIIDNQIQTQILKSFEIQTVWSKHCPFWTNKDCSTCILLRHVCFILGLYTYKWTMEVNHCHNEIKNLDPHMFYISQLDYYSRLLF